MKRVILVVLAVCLFSMAEAQIVWYSNYKVAKAVAIEKDQLILMDFWATWCGPCKKMDKELWNEEDVKALSENFIPFKVDVDRNQDLAIRYNASSIPKVVLVTATGEVVWEQMGFSSALLYKRAFEEIPENLNGLNGKLFALEEENPKNFYEKGLAYQQAGQDLDGQIGESLLRLSDDYFKKAEKKAEDPSLVAMAELNQLLNDVYRGKHKKAMKKIDKVEMTDDTELADFKNFIKAFCYKCDDDDKNYLEAKKTVKGKEYKSRLENE